MSERIEQDLDEMLSRHLHACLDSQVGRAALALRYELAPRPRWRLWTAAGTAIAAGLAVAIIMIVHRAPLPKMVTDQTDQPMVEAAVPMVQSATWSKLTDDGTTVVDDRPMRRMRRKVVNEVEWYDAKGGATVRTTVPQQQIYLIEMKTN